MNHSRHFLRSELLVTSVSLNENNTTWLVNTSYYDFNFQLLYDIFPDQNEVLAVTRRVQNAHSFKTICRVLHVHI